MLYEHRQRVSELSEIVNEMKPVSRGVHIAHPYLHGKYGKALSHSPDEVRVLDTCYKHAHSFLERFMARRKLKKLSKYSPDQVARETAKYELRHSGFRVWFYRHSCH